VEHQSPHSSLPGTCVQRLFTTLSLPKGCAGHRSLLQAVQCRTSWLLKHSHLYMTSSQQWQTVPADDCRRDAALKVCLRHLWIVYPLVCAVHKATTLAHIVGTHRWCCS
jgi:hypothetical protein